MDSTPEVEAELIESIASYVHDPLGFVRFAFPWGEAGTELADRELEDWQVEVLESIGARLREGADLEKAVPEAILEAVASGHGVGKSALVSWIILWAASTYEDARGVVTANTDAQLRTKTWAELAKWHRLCICGHWFHLTATALYSKDPDHEKTWRIDMIPWSEHRTEAFAGLHNQGKRILLIFDEASAIADKIWETSEGALTDTDTEIVWLAFGNPTRNTGRFKDCFGRFSHRWNTRHVDSRDVRLTNKAQLTAWVNDYGEDSDFCRVRVRGLFPKADVNALLGELEVRAAMGRTVQEGVYAVSPKVLGVDVARQGADRSVIFPRQGIVSFRPKVMRIQDSMLLSDQVARAWDTWKADGCLVDCTGGWGWGVYDRLVQMRYAPMPVDFGGAAFNPRFANKRAEIWWEMAEWIKQGGILPNLPDLERELVSQHYFHNKAGKLQMEDKDFVRDLIGESPDMADALACTFAFTVTKKSDVREGFAQTAFDPRTAGKGGFAQGVVSHRGFNRR
jgi:hypothetical protein